MKNIKRWIIIIIGIIIIVTVLSIVLKKNYNQQKEVINPEEEITEEAERRTLVTLYFNSKISNKLEPEVQLVDVKELVNNPYITIINLLIKGPRNNNLERILPEKTIVNKTILEGDVLIIDFNNEFVGENVQGEEQEKKIINSLANTLTELTEVNSIKILINGEENKGFNDDIIRFNTEFSKED